MSAAFNPIPLKQLLQLIINLINNNSFFNLPSEIVFNPLKYKKFNSLRFNQLLDIPLGVAAGPHTQMSQNIVASWLCGARYIELKTIQTLDEIEVSKPCIDMQDEGYNCEWSQELKIHESFDEYLNAWVIIHILNYHLFKRKEIGTIFNMSAGYDMKGILNENVQWFFDKMADCSIELNDKIDEIEEIYPIIRSISIPSKISDNITISTMHGCPPDEIEQIGRYFIEKRKLNTIIKLNPTLLGSEKLRNILNETLEFNVEVPGSAFDHDLKYHEALELIRKLGKSASENKVFFGIKLTNTLECLNKKTVFSKENSSMYMSGRALHPISIKLASILQNEFKGTLNISFSAGVDCFNFPDVLACGLQPVTVCTDFLKPGGYGRLSQYVENLNLQMIEKKANNIEEFIIKSAAEQNDTELCGLENLNLYADKIQLDKAYKKIGYKEPSIKINRPLSYFDCIIAPCMTNCPTEQDIPGYMYFTSIGSYTKAMEMIKETNPFPSVLGMICNHDCQLKCTRINYDSSLLIREIKRFISKQKIDVKQGLIGTIINQKVAIIGAGISGLSCANYLAENGIKVVIYESEDEAGGMILKSIPEFRIRKESLILDIQKITDKAVEIVYNQKINASDFEKIVNEFDFVYISVGAQHEVGLNIEGCDSKAVHKGIEFLKVVKAGEEVKLGNSVVIIGGGNTAMDAARTAKRLMGNKGKVSILYRRTMREMPANFEEIESVINEGIEIIELVSPVRIISEGDKVTGLECTRMKLGEPDSSGRPKPVNIEKSEFLIKTDSIIHALGQSTDISFATNTFRTRLPEKYETDNPKIYIGGDALKVGNAVEAVAAGRKVAEKILKRLKGKNEDPFREENHTSEDHKKISYNELMLKRYKRLQRPGILENPISENNPFLMVIDDLDEVSAKNESSRCLFCDELCNICVTVCPNMANFSYEINPFEIELKKAVLKDDKIVLENDGLFRISQKYQILNIANWCNECGNCTTFCPTDSAPYKAKPKIYLTKQSFDEAASGYYIFSLKNQFVLIYKENGLSHFLTETEEVYIYRDYLVSAKINKETLNFSDVSFMDESIKDASFQKTIEMCIIIKGAGKLCNIENCYP